MLLNYKYEIYPSEKQKKTLDSWLSICRHQYNSALLDKENWLTLKGLLKAYFAFLEALILFSASL